MLIETNVLTTTLRRYQRTTSLLACIIMCMGGWVCMNISSFLLY